MASRNRENRSSPKSIESYEHRDKERLNNPPVGLVTPDTDPDAGKKKYAYDPHLDPQLVWAGKAEHTSFTVPTVSLHVHERIDPRTIIEAVRKRDRGRPQQISLFEQEEKPLREAIEFYRHKEGWTNRLIAGDSLLVMNSLLEKEGLAGKVQMVYIDPPYGIKYGSNFQPFVNKRDVKDGKDEDLTAEPEQIRAFRDTWELGIHSYLAYLRDRLMVARELLTETGSIFVQIGDENVHLVRCVLDEVFGSENFVSLISVKRASVMFSKKYLNTACFFLIWYAKQIDQIKYRDLFEVRTPDTFAENSGSHLWVEKNDLSEIRKATPEERQNLGEFLKLNPDYRAFATLGLNAQGTEKQDSFEFQGKKYCPPSGTQWKTSYKGLEVLAKSNRIIMESNTVRYKQYLDDYPVMPINSLWNGIGAASDKIYVVQTPDEIVQRCLLMTTDPGDLVFDPTCGSGTTAYVAEQWGRRWITCDTSRVAITLARQRLMTSVFDYYELAHPEEGVGSGFKYKTVPHVTLKSIANNHEIDDIYARMHPAVERALSDLNSALRGHEIPFTVQTGGRSGQKVDFRAPDSATMKLPSGEEVPTHALLEWEVPFEFPEDWPDRAHAPFQAFQAARRTMQQAMDDAIARHAEQETLYDQPLVDRKKVRVTGPFTVEAVPAPAVKSVEELLTEASEEPADSSIARSSETLRQAEWRDELLRTGIRGNSGQFLRFSRLEPLPGCRWLHADGEIRPQAEGVDSGGTEGNASAGAPAAESRRVVVSFGPEYGPLEQKQVERAWEEARLLVPRPKFLVFAAFQFDPEAAKDIDELKPELAGMQLLKVQMNADLLTDDLKKKRASNEPFWLIGQPDVHVERIETGPDKGKYRVAVHGFDYYNTKTGQIESGGAEKIAIWLLDTDYDGRSLYPRQVFFPMAGENDGWTKLARNLKAEIDAQLIEAYRGMVSLPFAPGEHRRVAVKIVDDRGIESLRVLEVD